MTIFILVTTMINQLFPLTTFAVHRLIRNILKLLQGVPKKVGFTTCNSSSKSHFFWDNLYLQAFIFSRETTLELCC